MLLIEKSSKVREPFNSFGAIGPFNWCSDIMHREQMDLLIGICKVLLVLAG